MDMERKFHFTEQSPKEGDVTKLVTFKMTFGNNTEEIIGSKSGQYFVCDLDNNIVQWKGWMEKYKDDFAKSGYKFNL